MDNHKPAALTDEQVNMVLRKQGKGNKPPLREPWSAKPFTATELLLNPPPPPKWIVKGLLPVGLAYLAGRPKTGKSLFAGQIARVVTADEGTLFGLEARHGPALYVDVENSKWRLYERFVKGGLLVGGGSDRLHFQTDWTPGNRSEFLRLVDKITPVFSVIDIWAKFRARRHKDDDQYEFESEELRWLNATANERDMCILGVGHRTKFEDISDPFINFAGSTAITAGVDTMLAFSKVPGDTGQRELQLRGRDTGDESWILRVDEKLNCAKVCSGDQFVSPALARYLKLMAEKPSNAWTVRELSKAADVSFQAVAKAFDALRDRGLIEPSAMGGSLITAAGLQIAQAV
jgi:hypothetical protein